MNILRNYYSYKWYSQASRSLQEKLPSLGPFDGIDVAQKKYTVWLQYYAYINAERNGRISFRDNHVPVEKRDQGHEYQIKRCDVGSKMAYHNLSLFANHIASLQSKSECSHSDDSHDSLESLDSPASHDSVNSLESDDSDEAKKSIKRNQLDKFSKNRRNRHRKRNRHNKRIFTKNNISPIFDVEIDIVQLIGEIQKEAEQVEVQACIDVASLILSICPEFCARDEMVPGSINSVAMMEILLINQSCCQSRYGKGVWNKTTFLKNYNFVTLYSSIQTVNAQFELLQHISMYPDMKPLKIEITNLVRYMVKKTRQSGDIVMRSPTETGMTTANEFISFYSFGLEEVLTLLVYEFYFGERIAGTIHDDEEEDDIFSDEDDDEEEEEEARNKKDSKRSKQDSKQDSKKDKQEAAVDYIINMSIYQTSKECSTISTRKDSRLEELKNEQSAMNVVWILILCIENVDRLLQIPHEKKPFFDMWLTKFDENDCISQSTIMKLIKSMKQKDQDLLLSIIRKPRSRCCVGHMARCLNMIREE